MRPKSLILLLFAAVLLAGSALADEVVYFLNGTSMPVRSHEIADGMIKVTLDGDATLAFPMEQVDRIEDAEGRVSLDSKNGSNRMIPTNAASSAKGHVPRHRDQRWDTGMDTPPVETGEHGVAIMRPMGGSVQANQRKFGVTGNRAIMNRGPAQTNANGGIIGTTRVGQRYVLPTNESEKIRRTPIGIGAGNTGNSGNTGQNKKN